MKFIQFLKDVFISKFWIKLLSLIFAVLIVVLLNV